MDLFNFEIIFFITVYTLQYATSQLSTGTDVVKPTKSSDFSSSPNSSSLFSSVPDIIATTEYVSPNQSINISNNANTVSFSSVDSEVSKTVSSHSSSVVLPAHSTQGNIDSTEIQISSSSSTVDLQLNSTSSTVNIQPTPSHTLSSSSITMSTLSVKLSTGSSLMSSVSKASETDSDSKTIFSSESVHVSSSSLEKSATQSNSVIPPSTVIRTSTSYPVSVSSITHTTTPKTTTEAINSSSGSGNGGKIAAGIIVPVTVLLTALVGVYCYRKRKMMGNFNVPYRRWNSYGTGEDGLQMTSDTEDNF